VDLTDGAEGKGQVWCTLEIMSELVRQRKRALAEKSDLVAEEAIRKEGSFRIIQ